MHLLYIPMAKKEQTMGLVWLMLMLGSTLLFPLRTSALWEFVFYGANFAAALLIFRSFLAASVQVPLTPFTTVLKFSMLGLILAQLANLLTNAAKYARKGSTVLLQAELVGRRLRICVHNEGKTMEPDVLATAFSRCTQVQPFPEAEWGAGVRCVSANRPPCHRNRR